MKLQWLGHSCFKITLNDGREIVTDPYDDTVGYPPLRLRADIVLSSHGHFDHNYFAAVSGDPEIINAPGVYRRNGATITGVASYHDDARGAKRGENVIFAVQDGDVKLVHLGDLGHQPDTDEQRAILRDVDVLLIPIGGTYTITTPEAVKLIGDYQPRAAVAMHFKNRYCHFPVTDCSAFVEATGARTLPNEVEVSRGALAGCYVMEV